LMEGELRWVMVVMVMVMMVVVVVMADEVVQWSWEEFGRPVLLQPAGAWSSEIGS